MKLTLQLEDGMAELLRAEASEEQVSVEDLAQRMVRQALQERIATNTWRTQNRRRLELIATKSTSPLTVEEQQELGRLQTLAERAAVPFDKVLLQTVAEMRGRMDEPVKDHAS